MPAAAKTTKPTRRTRAGTQAERSPGLVLPRDFTGEDVKVARDIPAARGAVTHLFGDPAAEAKKIFAKLGDITGFKLFGNRIMVVMYERTTVGYSGALYAPPQTNLEDRYQGKVGLVVKMGPVAFVDDPASGIVFHGDAVKVGDWVSYSYSDGTNVDVCPPGSADKVHCKILVEGEIIGIVPRPDFLF